MLRLIIERFWFAFIPLVVYLIWLNLGENKEHPHQQNIKRIALGLCFVIMIISALYFGMSSEQLDGEYKPARYEDGVLIDGEIR